MTAAAVLQDRGSSMGTPRSFKPSYASASHVARGFELIAQRDWRVEDGFQTSDRNCPIACIADNRRWLDYHTNPLENLREALGVLRCTGVSFNELIAVLVSDRQGKGAQEEKGPAAKVPIKPEGKTVCPPAAANDDGTPFPEDPGDHWNTGKLLLFSLAQLRRRVKASFVYAEASEEDMALEYQRRDIIGRVIGTKEKAENQAEEKARVLASRQGRLEEKAQNALKNGIAKGRGEYVKAMKEKKSFFKAIEDTRDLNHLQRKELKSATSEMSKAMAAAAKKWVKEDGMEVLKVSAGLGGLFAGSALKALAG
ncbi:hypothetical protein CALCODRAFT_511817 [Calocera cornea HHB12733]|uniref:Uncharacterized protein n=1 Tax=Calocera cornea HHB12733 TaxID=1353952 RepID=A0A165DHW3_9BASI|nr:hypothetical protein CALCODRAFT_511817 [Calocera cornea HHB12733]